VIFKIIYLILFCSPTILVIIDFIKYLIKGSRLSDPITSKILDAIFIFILPLLYLIVDEKVNDCCGETATFSPNHRLTIYVFILLSVFSFFYSKYKKNILSPVLEVILNSMLLIGIVLNIFISKQLNSPLALAVNVPIIILFIFVLIENQKKLVEYLKTNEIGYNNFLEKISWKILESKPIKKIPLLFLACLPIITIITAMLILFGQKPDSIIRVFTDTYKHGFSQLDHLCIDAKCGGHYLCSIAANGHKKVVKPERLGVRNGNIIICNRQLLISNAFEELIEEKLPFFHKYIRTQYNKVGVVVHRYYDIFNIKIISDFIYFLMKPLELFFLLTLYIFDQKPENRIAKQYLKREEREIIDIKMKI